MKFSRYGVLPLVLAAAVGGCTSTTHTPVDLHLDIDAAPPLDAANVRLCSTNGVAMEYGATMVGTYVLSGLFVDSQPEITVDVLSEDRTLLGRAGPTTLLLDYQPTDYDTNPCGEVPNCAPCTGCVVKQLDGLPLPLCGPDDAPSADEQSWNLGVRFFGEN